VCAFPGFTVADSDDFLLSVPLHYLHDKKGSDYLHSKLSDMLTESVCTCSIIRSILFPLSPTLNYIRIVRIHVSRKEINIVMRNVGINIRVHVNRTCKSH